MQARLHCVLVCSLLRVRINELRYDRETRILLPSLSADCSVVLGKSLHSVQPSYCVWSGDSGLRFPLGSALKTTDIGFCMRTLDEHIFCFALHNVMILIIMLIKKKMKRKKEGEGRSCFTAAFSTEVSALQGLPPAHYNYLLKKKIQLM